MESHVVLEHFYEKPYMCHFCEKCFSRKEHRACHERVHTGEKPYTCNVCGRSFSYRSSLKHHSVTHLRKKTHTVFLRIVL